MDRLRLVADGCGSIVADGWILMYRYEQSYTSYLYNFGCSVRRVSLEPHELNSSDTAFYLSYGP